MKTPIILTEIDREVFGHDETAINHHSIRVYETPDGTRFQLDRTLDGCPPFFQLYGPYDAKYQGVLRSIAVDGKQYWGGGWSWRKAEAAMCQVLNATIQEQAIA